MSMTVGEVIAMITIMIGSGSLIGYLEWYDSHGGKERITEWRSRVYALVTRGGISKGR